MIYHGCIPRNSCKFIKKKSEAQVKHEKNHAWGYKNETKVI